MPPKQKRQFSKTFISSSSYYSDLHGESTIYAVLVRSPIASGTIRSITLADIPEGYALFTTDDLPNQNPIVVFDTSFPVFAREKISYEGEPIGMITGPNLATLHDLLQQISIVFTEVFNQTKDTEGKDKNIVTKRCLTYGTVKSKKETSIYTIESHSSVNLDLVETTESNGALCYASGKKLTVYTPTQWSKNLRENLESITGYSAQNIVIHKTKLPITEKNSPWKNTTLAVQCALASILTKQSVLLSLSHEEQRTFDDFRNVVGIDHSSQVASDGKILSSKVTIRLNVGAYNPFANIIADRLAITALGPYSPDSIDIEVVANSSENPPASSIIRWLDYHSFYAIETHMRKIATSTGLTPYEVRMKNILSNKAKYPFQFDTSTYESVLKTALQKSDFYRKYEIYTLNPYTKKSRGSYFPVRGIGLATAYEANGFLGAMVDTSLHSVEVTIDINSKVIIKVLNASETIATIWKEIASSILSVNIEDVVIDSLFYQNEEASIPETMLNNMYITSQLLKKACTAVQKSRFHQPLPISVKRTFNLANKKTWNSERFSGKPFYVTSWIALVAEIELVLPISSFEVRNIYISIDAGNVMNKRKARYAIQSCVKRILSQIMKNQVYSEPDISITFLESTDEPKQIRELVYNTLPAALTNALSHTVQEILHEFPIEQETIFELFQKINDTGISDDFTEIEEENDANKSVNKS